MALFFHSVLCSPSLLRNKLITSVSRLVSLSRVGTTVFGIQGSAEGFIACSDQEHRRGGRSGRTLRVSSSSAGRPRHESSIAKNYLKSSSIEKNCLRSSSTWTSGVHRDKESLPNSKIQKPDWYSSDRSSRRDCRVSTNWSSKESATNQASLTSTGSVFKMHGSAPNTHL